VFHREAGVFKTSYAADMALYPLPIAQWAVAAAAALFILVAPLTLGEYYVSILNLILIAGGACTVLLAWRSQAAHEAARIFGVEHNIEWAAILHAFLFNSRPVQHLKLSSRFRHRGTHGEHGLVDHLTQAQIHGDAAQQISMHGRESPVFTEQIDHARGGGAGGGDRVVRRFNDDPGRSVGTSWGVGGVSCFSRLNERPGQCAMFVQLKTQRHVRRAFDAVDADFAVALRRVRIAR